MGNIQRNNKKNSQCFPVRKFLPNTIKKQNWPKSSEILACKPTLVIIYTMRGGKEDPVTICNEINKFMGTSAPEAVKQINPIENFVIYNQKFKKQA